MIGIIMIGIIKIGISIDFECRVDELIGEGVKEGIKDGIGWIIIFEEYICDKFEI